MLFLLSLRFGQISPLAFFRWFLPRTRIGMMSLVTVPPVITAFHSCCVSHHVTGDTVTRLIIPIRGRGKNHLKLGWEPFGSAHGLFRCNIEAAVNAGAPGRMEVSLRCHNSPRRNGLTGCRWRDAPEARGGLCELWRKLTSWELDTKREGSTFGARRREANLLPMGAARDGGQMNKTA